MALAAVAALLLSGCMRPASPARPEPPSPTPPRPRVEARAQETNACTGRFASALTCRGLLAFEPELVQRIAVVAVDELGVPARVAARWNMRSAAPVLRARVREWLASDEREQTLGLWAMADVATALAELDDVAAVPELERLAVATEDRSPSVHDATLAALLRLDREAAARTGSDFFVRTLAALDTASRLTRLRALLPLLAASHAVPVLPRLDELERHARELDVLGRAKLRSELDAVRIRLGDAATAARYRAQLAVRNARVPVRPELLIGALGDHPDDADALARFAGGPDREGPAAHAAIDRYLEHHAAATAKGGRDARAWHRGLVRLHRRLLKTRDYLDDPAVPWWVDPSHRARVHGVLARLGEQGSARTLLELAAGDVAHPRTWIAANEALRVGVPGAADAAADLLMRQVRTQGPIGELAIDLLDTAVEVQGGSDPRWVAALFHHALQDRAIHHVVRARLDATFCTTWMAAARASVRGRVSEGVLEDGLLTITRLPGRQCDDELLAMATAVDEQGTALPFRALWMLAMQDSPHFDAAFAVLSGRLGRRQKATIGQTRALVRADARRG